MNEDRNTEEFDCPPGRVTVDLVDEDGHQGRGIHIYYFDDTTGAMGDMIHQAMLPSKKQWDHVRDSVIRYLNTVLE